MKYTVVHFVTVEAHNKKQADDIGTGIIQGWADETDPPVYTYVVKGPYPHLIIPPTA